MGAPLDQPVPSELSVPQILLKMADLPAIGLLDTASFAFDQP